MVNFQLTDVKELLSSPSLKHKHVLMPVVIVPALLWKYYHSDVHSGLKCLQSNTCPVNKTDICSLILNHLIVFVGKMWPISVDIFIYNRLCFLSSLYLK